jgi:L-threonylcarbamoyladenylate synthase
MTLFYGEDAPSAIIRRIKESSGDIVGVLCADDTAPLYGAFPNAEIVSVGDRGDPLSVGSRLFAALRRFDNMGVSAVFAEAFEETGRWLAVMDRLKRAAGERVR